jgi:endonuclease/exonuclease/phosphatase (EEP) superfamily protein YafD
MAGLRRWARRLLLVLAVIYPLALLIVVIWLRTYGESSWLARAFLYVPRVALGLPLPLLVVALALVRAWRWQVTQAAALGLVLFPLMGLVLPGPSGADPAAPRLRVMSFNVNSGYWGWDQVMAQIDEHEPDVVLIQEVVDLPAPGIERLKRRYPAVESSTQFIVASRYTIQSTVDPARVPLGGRQRSPRFMRHVIETPLGPIAFYNVHPISPRQGLWALRKGGFKQGILSGSLFRGETARRMREDGELRDRQVEAFTAEARKETLPVVIGGDTNLPDLSPGLRFLADFDDGFRAAGWGFGYTYPAGRRAWMRLDRIYASRSLRFVDFRVGKHAWASDHHCVVADLQRRET